MTKEISCPICKKPLGESAQYFPFCSERCKLLDLGAWASGKYTIPGSEADAEDSIDSEGEEKH